MKALTPHRPWDLAFERYGKRVENRTWAIPARHRGQPIALHAGKAWDDDGAQFITRLLRERGETPSFAGSKAGTIFAVAWFDRIITAGDPGSEDPWFFGPCGWSVARLEVLPERIPCSGMQGLWNLPADVADAVQKSEARGVRHRSETPPPAP